MAVLVVTVCTVVAIGVWAAVLRHVDEPADKALLCGRYADLRGAILDDGIGADAAVRTRTIMLADAADRYPDETIQRTGADLEAELTATGATPADLLEVARPVATVCGEE